MPKSISDPRKELVKLAEKALERPLSAEERKAVRGFAEPVVDYAVKSLNPKEIIELLDGVCGEDSPVVLLNRLANKTTSFTAGRRILLKFVDPRAREIVERFDFDSEFEKFSNWLLALIHANPIPAEIKALHFGLFESERSFKLYVNGTKDYGEDSGWSYENHWQPQETYKPTRGLSKMYSALRKTSAEPWVVAQAITILLIKLFFKLHAAEFKKISKYAKLQVVSGFDDGDLYTLKISHIYK